MISIIVTAVRRAGRAPTLYVCARRGVVREAAKKPTITLKELQGSMVKKGDTMHTTTVFRMLYGKVKTTVEKMSPDI